MSSTFRNFGQRGAIAFHGRGRRTPPDPCPELLEIARAAKKWPSEAFSGTAGSRDSCGSIVESAMDFAIYTVDPNGIATSWNPGAERLLG